MALEVGLVDHVHAQFVAQVVERRIVGIVRGAHRRDVVAAHLHQVGAHVVGRDRLTAGGVVIVAVDAEDPDRLAVHQQLPVAHLDMPEADELFGGFGHLAVGPHQLDAHAIARGRLGAPRRHSGNLPACLHLVAGEHIRLLEPMRNHTALHGAHTAARQRLEPGADHEPLGRLRREPHGGAHVQQTCTVGEAQIGGAGHIGHVHGAARLDPHTAVQAGHPPLVLVFDVALGAVAHHDDGEMIDAGPQMWGEVVLAGQAAVGAVPDEHVVEVDRVHALGTAQVQHHAVAVPALAEGERAPVHASGVAVGQGGRRPGEGHLHVGVVRQVAHVLQSPVPGHRHLPTGPRRGATDRLGRYRIGVIEQFEPPRAVERPASIGAERQRYVHRQPMEFEQSRVGPGPQRTDDGQHAQPPCTQTVIPIGIRFWSQMKSIAGTLTRTQPCDAG